mmetsp:Transcript_100095/g.238571  ORF Transcript_100095/g.238571 Transcript_100095/m.238571 type:complete len:212 (+) Transcript_100095:873-1508(+)
MPNPTPATPATTYRASCAPSAGAKEYGIIKQSVLRKARTEQGPTSVGVTTRSLSLRCLLFKKAASSKTHHNLFAKVVSQRTSMESDLSRTPARLQIASAFKLPSTWLMHRRSRNTFFLFRHKTKVTAATSAPRPSDQAENWISPQPYGRRWKPGRRPQENKAAARIAARVASSMAAGPLFSTSSVEYLCHTLPCQECDQKFWIFSAIRLLP